MKHNATTYAAELRRQQRRLNINPLDPPTTGPTAERLRREMHKWLNKAREEYNKLPARKKGI